MKRLDVDKIMEKLSLMTDSLKLEDDVVIDDYDEYVIDFSEEVLNHIENGLPKGNWNYRYAFTVEYLRQFKDEIIIKEYSYNEVKNILENKLHLKVDDNSIITTDNHAVCRMDELLNCLNLGWKSIFTTAERLIVNYITNEEE